MSDSVAASLDKVETWIQDHDRKGYEAFDGLGSWLRPLAFGNLFGERLLQQLVRQSPINLRPVLGVKPQPSTKGTGYIAWGYLYRYKATRKKEFLAQAEECLDWLDKHKSPHYQTHSWGNHFDYVSRGGSIPMHEPTIVWTSLIGQPFLEAYELTGNKKYLAVAESACAWILSIPREKTATGDCLSYVAFTQSPIHNASMLGAATLARTWKHTQNPEYLAVAKSAMLYSCSRLRPDGSWWYGEAADRRWIDNFHTGYNLCALRCYIEASGDKTFESEMLKAFKYWKDTFFEADGCPRYYNNRTYPIDIQCSSQAIDTFCRFADLDADGLPMAKKIAAWTIENMQAADGHFYYRKYPMMTAKAPMIHWGQATMFKALAELIEKLTPEKSKISEWSITSAMPHDPNQVPAQS